MNELQAEADFFKEIAPKVLELVLSFEGNASVSVQKIVGDFATEVDIAVENLIVDEINKRFPNDLILAEEGHSDTEIPEGRIWIIDPICGTTNIGRGIQGFCTNIALADNGALIASCVVDHPRQDYFWSVGGNQVFVNDQIWQAPVRPEGFGKVVDVDFGSVLKITSEQKDRYARALRTLLDEPGLMLMSLNSSLPFAYTAIGKLDGFLNSTNHPWDICASSFLLQQAGGVITGLDGEGWTLTTVGAVGSLDPDTHRLLVESLKG